MSWKEWPYWLKSGLVGVIGLIGLTIIWIILSGLLIGYYEFYPLVLVSYPIFIPILKILSLLSVSCAGEECMGLYILIFPSILIEGFIIGMLVGWAYGKITSKQ